MGPCPLEVTSTFDCAAADRSLEWTLLQHRCNTAISNPETNIKVWLKVRSEAYLACSLTLQTIAKCPAAKHCCTLYLTCVELVCDPVLVLSLLLRRHDHVHCEWHQPRLAPGDGAVLLQRHPASGDCNLLHCDVLLWVSCDWAAALGRSKSHSVGWLVICACLKELSALLAHWPVSQGLVLVKSGTDPLQISPRHSRALLRLWRILTDHAFRADAHTCADGWIRTRSLRHLDSTWPSHFPCIEQSDKRILDWRNWCRLATRIVDRQVAFACTATAMPRSTPRKCRDACAITFSFHVLLGCLACLRSDLVSASWL